MQCQLHLVLFLLASAISLAFVFMIPVVVLGIIFGSVTVKVQPSNVVLSDLLDQRNSEIGSANNPKLINTIDLDNIDLE